MKQSNRLWRVLDGRKLAAALGTALLAGSAAMPAFAALGDDVASIENDRAQMKGQLRLTSVAGYAVHELQLPSGTVVREYVSSGGKVFAVSWRGPAIPDLQQTLGTYFEQYKAASGTTDRGHHHLAVREPSLVAHAGGHMRAWAGQAYVPALLPPNFSVDDIK
jgi:hypothetical protein